MAEIPSVGSVIAESIVVFFERHRTTVERFQALGIDPVFAETSGIFSGQKFVLTGSLSRYTRSQAAAEIVSRGGIVQSSVTKETDFVVAGADAGSKLAKAQKAGVKILDENAFIDLLNA